MAGLSLGRRPLLRPGCSAIWMPRRLVSGTYHDAGPRPMPVEAAITIRITESKNALQLQQVLEEELQSPRFTPINVSAAWSTWARIGRTKAFESSRSSAQTLAPAIVGKMVEMATSHASTNQFMAQGLANVTWSVTVLQSETFDHPKLLTTLFQAVQHRASDMNAQEICNVLWSASKCASELPDDAQKMVEALVPIAVRKTMSGIDAANILICAASINSKSPALGKHVPELCKTIQLRAPDLKGLALCQAAWGLALLGRQEPLLLETLQAVADASAAGIPTWTGSSRFMDVSLITLALARMQFRHAGFLKAVEQSVEQDVAFLSDWELCAHAWAFPRLDPEKRHQRLQETFEAELKRRGLTEQAVQASADGPKNWILRQENMG